MSSHWMVRTSSPAPTSCNPTNTCYLHSLSSSLYLILLSSVLGNDIASGPIWLDYLTFLQGPKPGMDSFMTLFPNTNPGQEEQARAVVLRRAYQRATVVPSHSLDAIYRQYENFENVSSGGNKALSR